MRGRDNPILLSLPQPDKCGSVYVWKCLRGTYPAIATRSARPTTSSTTSGCRTSSRPSTSRAAARIPPLPSPSPPSKTGSATRAAERPSTAPHLPQLDIARPTSVEMCTWHPSGLRLRRRPAGVAPRAGRLRQGQRRGFRHYPRHHLHKKPAPPRGRLSAPAPLRDRHNSTSPTQQPDHAAKRQSMRLPATPTALPCPHWNAMHPRRAPQIMNVCVHQSRLFLTLNRFT